MQRIVSDPLTVTLRPAAMAPKGYKKDPVLGCYLPPSPPRSRSPPGSASATTRRSSSRARPRRSDTPPPHAAEAAAPAAASGSRSGAGAGRRPPARRPRPTWRKWAKRLVPKKWLHFLLWVSALFSVSSCLQPSFMQSARSLSTSVAAVGEAAADLASASANVTVAVVNVAADAILIAHGALDEACKGIDVTNIKVGRIHCEAIGETREALVQYLEKGASTQLPSRAVGALTAAVRDAAAGIPAAERRHEFFDANGEFWVFAVRIRMRQDGTVTGAMLASNATFTAQWTNPLWEGLGFDVSSESPRIAQSLRLTLDAQDRLPPSAFAIDDRTLLLELGVAAGWTIFSKRQAQRAGIILGLALFSWLVRHHPWVVAAGERLSATQAYMEARWWAPNESAQETGATDDGWTVEDHISEASTSTPGSAGRGEL